MDIYWYTVFLAGKSPSLRSYKVWCISGINGWEIIKYTVIYVYGIYIQLWPSLRTLRTPAW